MHARPMPDPATVNAARDGDAGALDAVVAGSLPLVYNIVGRALHGNADVDDVVQETMIRVVNGLSGLRDPERFRPWLVAIAMNQVRERHRGRQTAPLVVEDEVADPGADFVDLTILRLGLTGQREETAAATRWLDLADREVLSLWWLEAAGELTRDEVTEALGVSRAHAAVTIQRVRARLDTARAVVRALRETRRCSSLAEMAESWDGRPSPLWRKRFARHTRECSFCGRAHTGLVDAARLLVGAGLVPVPAAIAVHSGVGPGVGASAASSAVHLPARGARAWLRRYLLTRPAVAAATGVLAVATTAAVVFAQDPAPSPARTVATASPVPSGPPSTASTSPPAQPSPTASSSSASISPSTATPAAAGPIAARTAKKGVSAWSFDGVDGALSDVHASWYYTWGATRGAVTAPAGVEFVPMIWGASSVTAPTLAQARAQGSVLLGFNEPDMASQANMSPQQALDLWPQLQATGAQLGSPAPATGDATAGGWLDQFMSGARTRGYRVDFIAVHWYGSDFSTAATDQLKSYLQAIHQRYQLPLWLTEYALIKFSDGGSTYPTQAQQVAFVKSSTAMLESLPYVQRYAWFALPSTKTGDTGLYRNASTPTDVGAAYRAAGPSQ